MEKIVIIGGGASGLIASIYAKTKTNQVIILEKNTNCGKKLLITGNGRCNYWNEDQSLEHYHSNHPELLSDIITSKNQGDILNFFRQIGITPKIKNGYYYPFSNQAVSIQYALVLEAKIKGVEIHTDILVEDIMTKEDQFIITTNRENIIADKIVLATGSKACPKTGSDGKGYLLAERLGHSIISVEPALVSLMGEYSYLKKWNGIRTDVIVTLYENGNIIKTEEGEIQLTDYGISGICTFNLSRYAAIGLKQQKKEYITINFLPFLNSKKECIDWLEKQNKQVKNRTIGELLEATLNYKLVDVLLKIAQIPYTQIWTNCTKKEQMKLIDLLYSFHFDIQKTNTFEKAQVCSGGIPLIEINPNTMESNIVKNLYFTGEILDVDGDCGGYNLSFAWITGMLAGKDIRSKTNDSN